MDDVDRHVVSALRHVAEGDTYQVGATVENRVKLKLWKMPMSPFSQPVPHKRYGAGAPHAADRVLQMSGNVDATEPNSSSLVLLHGQVLWRLYESSSGVRVEECHLVGPGNDPSGRIWLP